MYMKKLLSIIIIIICFSCASQKIKSPPTTNTSNSKFLSEIQEEDKNYVLPLLYATNRKKVKRNESIVFNGKRDDSLHYGIMNISIPKNHVRGNLELPTFIDKIKGHHNDTAKFFILKKNQFLEKSIFYDSLHYYMGNLKDSTQAYVFIHGYNTDFIGAAYRSAQLFFDLKASGVPIMFTWPSKGKTYGYWKDQSMADKSAEIFKKFISETSKQLNGKPLNIIAHSMGNKVLTKALQDLPKEFPNIKFNNIIMAAPDVASSKFKNEFLDDMKNCSSSITLYSSNKDKALKVSRYLNFRKRLGFGGKHLFIADGINTIDLSDLTCQDILSHSCFAENPVLVDIEQIFKSTYQKDLLLKRVPRTWNQDKTYYILK